MATQQLTTQQKQEQINAIVADDRRFKELLPPDIDVVKFIAVIKRALQVTPALYTADKASLLISCQQAAQDGLMPDGREGAIVLYGNKAQWQPMIGGIRKRLADAGFDIRADMVHENDDFEYDLGDEPRIHHKAPKLGTPRGPIIGAYAIATDEAGRKYREVMSLEQLDAVAKASRSGGSGPWAGPFRSEMYRKTVARRLAKTLPVGSSDAADRAAGMFQRDDERNFAFEAAQTPSDAAQRAQAAARGQSGAKPASGQQTPPQDDDGAVDVEVTVVTDGDGGQGGVAEF